MIGRGGMGDVFLAMARGPAGFKKLVVVKSLRLTTEDDETLRRMFLDEGRLAAHLNHPNVVQIFDVGIADGNPYIAMEYLDGQPLSKIARLVGRLDPPIAARIASDVLAGLHYAHELCGFDGKPLLMVHRDLSPPNIIVSYDGVVKLMDFGIAKAALPSRALTDIGTLKGKVSYMAPEQATSEEIDRRADIFAMGVVLWELLVGKRLVADSSAAAALRQLLLGTFPSVSSQLPGIDPELDRIVTRALEKEPDARYSTALEMRDDLEAYLAQSGSTVRSEDLSRLLAQHFAVQRSQMQEVIQACIAAADSDSASHLPVIPRGDSNTDELRRSLPAGDLSARPSTSSAPPISASWRDEADFRRQLKPVTPVKKPLLVGGVALFCAGLVAGFMYVRHRSPTASLPAASPAAASAAPAIAKANEATRSAAQGPASAPFQPQAGGSLADAVAANRREHGAHVTSSAPLARVTPIRSIAATQGPAVTPSPPPSPQPAAAVAPAPLVTDDKTKGATTNSTTKTVVSRRVPLVEDRPRAPLVE